MADNSITITPAGPAEPTSPDLARVDPFDPSRYRITSVAASLGVKKALTHVPVGRPPKGTFVRAHPAPEFTDTLALYESPDRDVYLVLPDVLPHVPSSVKVYTVTLSIDRQGNLFLWKVPAAEEGVRRRGGNAWAESLAEALKHARRSWVRVEANQAAGSYDVFVAGSAIPDPDWPSDLELVDYLRLAFGNGGVIESPDHPVVRQLHGL